MTDDELRFLYGDDYRRYFQGPRPLRVERVLVEAHSDPTTPLPRPEDART